MKKYLYVIAILFTISLIMIGCSNDADNETGNENTDGNTAEKKDESNDDSEDGDDNENAHATRDDMDEDDLVAIRTAQAGEQAENKVFAHEDTMGYYEVLNNVEVNSEFTAGDIDFSINKVLFADFVPYEGTLLNGVDEFPMNSLILVIDTKTDNEELASPDLYMAVNSIKFETRDEEELTPVLDLNPQTVGGESKSSLNVFNIDPEMTLEDIKGITLTINPQLWGEEATEDDIVTEEIDLN